VSVLLATRRPEMLPFALTQVAKQTGARIEVVLAAHGFDVDDGLVRDHLGDRPVVVRPVPAGTRFGDVLDAAARAASGDVVLKMDDDDWYGPDVVSDLLWARRTSGAELVGMAAEFVYLEPIDVTVRRRTTVERAAQVVAGGTMLLDAAYLRELGGFRSVTRFVDAQLLAAVRRAGGTVHRTQGLGYVLRRGGGGHTWSTDLGYFLTRRSVVGQWRGFRPSALLGYDESELPAVGVR
jgi:glycosyltransferase involved in cell wall biosynthesis